MKSKGLLKNVLGLGLILFLGIYFTSCEKDKPAPTLDIYVTVNGFTVDIAAEATNTTSWSWDYGDGTVSDSVGSHTHTYATGGNYTIKCTVTGEGGELTKTKAVTIATIKDLLSGGSSATNGKTWILSRKAGGSDGVGFVKEALAPDYFPAVNDMLDVLGLSEEYDNEYTFYFDGTYKVNNKDGESLAGWLYSADVIGMDKVVATTPYGIFKVSRTNTSSATWDLFEDTDLSIDVVDESDASEKTVTFEGADYITFGGGGYIGIEDYYTSIIVRDITADRMVVTVFMHSYEPIPTKPSIQLTMTLDAK